MRRRGLAPRIEEREINARMGMSPVFGGGRTVPQRNPAKLGLPAKGSPAALRENSEAGSHRLTSVG